MSDPTMDQIEQGLRAMSEPRNPEGAGGADGSTELWKRALEISRAEERAGLVHPAADREASPRGRRMLIALNAVGVAAMVLLAAGVWTIMRPGVPAEPSPNEQAAAAAGIGPDVSAYADQGVSLFADQRAGDNSDAIPDDALAQAKTESDEARIASRQGAAIVAEDSAQGDAAQLLADLGRAVEAEGDALDPVRAQSEPAAERMGMRSRSIEKPETSWREIAATPESELADVDAVDPTVAVDDSHPGISQMAMAPEAGLALEEADASVMAFDPYLVNADIVIEVSDVKSAFNALSEMPRAEFDEFSVVVPDESGDGAEPLGALVLNMSPARLEQTLGEIRGLGRVVEERRQIDTPARRAGAAIDWALMNTAPGTRALETVIEAQGLTEHERAHRHLPINEAEQLEAARDVFTEISRKLEMTRRSMNLSRINISIRQATDSDTIEE
ncbi:MAG: hypothetical protein ACIARQ_08390 [Phycisphaerales bacterium JB061]